jgi:NADH dehydrogenase
MPAPPPFRYRSIGNLATIGRKSAVVDFGWVRLTGRLAWLVWGVAHIYFLIGFRNRMAVAVDWLWSYLTYQRGARLITGENPRMSPAASKQ